ncbi:MAG TPA: protein-glutamate O-methyltransferase CheR [Bacteroidales bacterium]|nr:protein-glutamate O-methyltransferase CheR [Bacteroidales bacterium]
MSNYNPAEGSKEFFKQDLEIRLLLEAIHQVYGYDFKSYNQAHVRRRLLQRVQNLGLKSVSELQHRLLHEEHFVEILLRDLSINVTEMFRDPGFYRSIRKEVVPVLRTYPYLKIWHAGCSTGEEVFSFAILLHEEGLLDRTQIYATDFNPMVLETARKGIYPVSRIKEYTQNYQAAGGISSFSDYFLARYDSVIMDDKLRKNIVFAEHNLVTDNIFAEVHMIICRNVLIYFNKELQNRVLKLFSDSLVKGGYLGLGSKENIMFTEVAEAFTTVDGIEKIYKKKIVLGF